MEVEFRPWPRDPRYLIGSDGTIIGVKGHPRVLRRRPDGYLTFGIGTPCYPMGAHIAVCETFHGERPSPAHEVAHDNNVRHDNRAANLSWKTRTGNMHDKYRHGTHVFGEAHRNAKLTEERVREARASSATTAELAARFGVARRTLRLARRGETWAHVS